MENKKEKKQKINWKIILVGTIFIIIYKIIDCLPQVYDFLAHFVSILMPLNIGILISIFLYIPTKFFEKKFLKTKNKFLNKKATPIAITITYILALIFLIIVFSTLIPMLYDSAKDLIMNLGQYGQELIQKVEFIKENYGIDLTSLKDMIYNLKVSDFLSFDNISSYTKSIVGVGSNILNIFIAIIISIYILSERRNIYNFIMRICRACVSNTYYESIKKYSDNAITIFINFINAQLVDAVVIGVLETIVLSVLNVKYAVFLGFLIGISNIIPYFGAIVGVGSACIITIFSGGIVQAFWMLIAVTIMQQIDANIINPKIVGEQLKISPLLVIVSVVIGGAYFGVAGMFLAVPFAALLKLILIDSVDERLKEIETKQKLKNKTTSKVQKYIKIN